MLEHPKITAFIPTTKPGQSKQFYQDSLGLKLVSEDEYALEFHGNGTILRITTVPTFEPYPFTVLGFKIENIESQVESLVSKGIKFERFEFMNQDAHGIWTSPSKAKVAWFKDPDGNLVSLTEYP